MKLAIFGTGKGCIALAKALGIKRNRKGDAVIRWKTVERIPFAYEIEWNKAEAVRLSSNKFKTLQVLKEAGLLVPPHSQTLESVCLEVDDGDIVFGRTRFHTQGQDIIAMRMDRRNPSWFYPQDMTLGARENFLTKEYFVKWLDSKGEYRTHVAFGKVIFRTKKVSDNPNAPKLIRNHQNGLWKQVECKPTEKFDQACIRAVAALGLDFGAVDFINVAGKPYILEVNTAPGLEVENRIVAYAEAFRGEI